MLVELQPVEASVDPRGRVRFSGAATTLTLRPGETVAIGGIDRSSTSHTTGSRVLSASQQTRESRVLLLGVEVEGGDLGAETEPSPAASDKQEP